MVVYEYIINKNNELVSEERSRRTERGYLETTDKYGNPIKVWISEEKLEFLNPDNSPKYKIKYKKLAETLVFDPVEFEKEKMRKEVNFLCIELIESYDWRVIRHLEQLKLIEAGKLTETSISEEEYITMLENKQAYRELSNIAELMISMMENIENGRSNFNYDFRDPEVVKERLVAWKTEYNL